MKHFFTKIIFILLLGWAGSLPLYAQIYAPEGINMPGDWDNWSNPPANLVFAGESQTAGGKVHLVSLQHPFYQTIFHVASSGADVAGGSYYFKFTSGPPREHTIFKDTATALKRVEAMVPLYFGVPGPKMLWQFEELGYDYSINRCPDGTISTDCRTTAKPVRWDYWQDSTRQKLYEVFAGMAKLKTENQAFLTGTVTKNLSSLNKRNWITDASMDVCIGANLNVNTTTMKPKFQHTGTLYNYFSGKARQVSDAGGYSLTMKPGDFYVFTDKKLTRPFVNLTFKVIYSGSSAPVPNAVITLGKYGKYTTGADGLAHFTPVSNTQYPFSVHFSSYADTSGVVQITHKNRTITIRIVATGVEKRTMNNPLNIYPNLTSGKFTVDIRETGIIQVSDLNGKILLHEQLNARKTILSVSRFRAGLYLLKFTGKSQTVMRKLIVR